MPVHEVEFRGSHGAVLSGRLELPEGPTRAYAVFAHCFTCGKQSLAATRLSRELAEHGIAVLRFDFTGLGHSEGDFAETTFSSNVNDLVHAADFLRDTYEAPAVLVGHSLGGAAVLAAAESVPEVRAVVTIGAPADTSHVLRLIAADAREIDEHGSAEIHLGERAFRVTREFLDDVREQPQRERMARLSAALLVMHSPVDQVVGIDNAEKIYQAAKHPKSFVALDDADHLLTRASDARFAASVIGAWLERYLPEIEAEEPAEGTVVVAESDAGRYAQHIRVGSHRFTADEPRPVGTDTGPSPYDLLLASLGTCTSMTLRMYADRKQWPLEHVEVALRHSRIHAKDCAKCEAASGQLDHLEREIELVGELDEEQRQRLLEIADKCPVHRTLRSEITTETRLRPGR